MKKRFIIYSLFLSGSFIFSLSIQAQQQKKPSERSFTAEINKVKQIQATRNTQVSKMPQPTDNTTVVDEQKQVIKEQDQPTDTNTSAQKQQISPATKPSTGSLRQPKKPVVSKE